MSDQLGSDALGAALDSVGLELVCIDVNTQRIRQASRGARDALRLNDDLVAAVELSELEDELAAATAAVLAELRGRRTRVEIDSIVRELGQIVGATVLLSRTTIDGDPAIVVTRLPAGVTALRSRPPGATTAAEPQPPRPRDISEEQFSLAFEHANEGMAIVARDGTYLRVNPRLAEMLGRPVADIVGRHVYEFRHDNNIGSFQASSIDVERFGHHTFDRVYERPDGTPVMVRISASVVHDSDGQPLHHVALYTDETERRALESRSRQREQLELIGQLAGGIAHDVNNLLSGVLGYAELVRALIDDPLVLGYCEQIISSSMRAADFTGRLLDLSRPAGTADTEFDVHDVLHEVVDFVRTNSDPRVSVVTEFDAFEHTIIGDANQLHGAVLNLAINGRDAILSESDHGGVLTVRTSNYFGGSGLPDLVVEVADTGPGIPREHIEHIFDPFFTTKPKGRGTGLGLTSVLATTHRHHGTIDVTRAPGAGALFRLQFPTIEGDRSRDAARSPDLLPAGLEVLVVDDDPDIRFVVAETLARHGIHVTTAADGYEALAIIDDAVRAPDAIVFDLRMSGMGGSELLPLVLQRCPAILTVLMTGNARDPEIDELYRLGLHSALQKPVRREEIVAALEPLRRVGSDG